MIKLAICDGQINYSFFYYINIFQVTSTIRYKKGVNSLSSSPQIQYLCGFPHSSWMLPWQTKSIFIILTNSFKCFKLIQNFNE